MTPLGLSYLAELSEANAYARLLDGAPDDLRATHGLSVEHVGDALALVGAHVAGSLTLNRVIGLGVRTPATAAQIIEIGVLYRARGVLSHAIELSPHAVPEDLPFQLRGLGYLPFKRTTMMARAVEVLSAEGCPHAVRRARPADATAFAQLACGLFGFEQPFLGLLAASFDLPCWQHWMAYDGARPVATAMSCTMGDVVWIGWVGTLPDYRGRGIQAAITAMQIQAARNSGARWITLETALGSKGQPGASQRNYLRWGWAALYNRVVYLRRPG